MSAIPLGTLPRPGIGMLGAAPKPSLRAYKYGKLSGPCAGKTPRGRAEPDFEGETTGGR